MKTQQENFSNELETKLKTGTSENIAEGQGRSQGGGVSVSGVF